MTGRKISVATGKLGVPFGSKAKRFLPVGYHPNLEYRPGTHGFVKIAPGCYDLTKRRKIVSKVPRWKREVEVENFSRNLGYLSAQTTKKKQWLNSINGPGWQDVPSCSFIPGIILPTSERFVDGKFSSEGSPGPGTYGKNHVPHARMEEKTLAKGFSFSVLPSFEQQSRAPRSLNVQLSYHLPPNLYTVKNSTDELLSKRVSKRGPYDLFSVERFPDPVVMKHTASTQKVHPWNWNHPKNSFKGQFSRCGKESQITSRLALVIYAWSKKNPLDPGPSHYNPYPTLPVPQSYAPFNTSTPEARPSIKCKISPPPGRYQPEMKKRIKGDGMRSCFLSKVQRNFNKRDKYSWFE